MTAPPAFFEHEIKAARKFARLMFVNQAAATAALYLLTPSSVTARLWAASGPVGVVVGVLFVASVVALFADMLLHDILGYRLSETVRRWRWAPISALSVSYWLTGSISLLHSQDGGVSVIVVYYWTSAVLGIMFAWHIKTTIIRRVKAEGRQC